MNKTTTHPALEAAIAAVNEDDSLLISVTLVVGEHALGGYLIHPSRYQIGVAERIKTTNKYKQTATGGLGDDVDEEGPVPAARRARMVSLSDETRSLKQLPSGYVYLQANDNGSDVFWAIRKDAISAFAVLGGWFVRPLSDG